LDGKIIVSGNFFSYNGVSSNSIIRLNPNGSIDNTFIVGTGFSSPFGRGPVDGAVLQDDGRIVLVGRFTSYNGTPCNNIIRLNPNGTKDTTFAPTTGFNLNPNAPGYVQALSTDKNNNIYVGNQSTTYNGNAVGSIVKMNQLATYDSTFNQGSIVFNRTGLGFNSQVASIINLIT
jgi:hypothetical protein